MNIKGSHLAVAIAAAIPAGAAGYYGANTFREPNTITGPATVIDGDGLKIEGVEVRLARIDAPERDQECKDSHSTSYRCGEVSAEALSKLVEGTTVTCTRDASEDRWKRFLGLCVLDNGLDINAEQVRLGMALTYHRTPKPYSAQEMEARANRRGIWSGDFELPECVRAAKDRRTCPSRRQ